MSRDRLKMANATNLVVPLVLLASFATAPLYAFAQGGDPSAADDWYKSKIRALQDGNLLDIQTDVEGSAGTPVDCVGGIESSANATGVKCYLLTDNQTWASDYKSDPSAIVQDAVAEPCPEGAGFEASKDCFVTTFDSSNFAGQGNYRFVAEFYNGDTLLDVESSDYRLKSFFVLPESAIGAIALVGSSLAVFGAYRIFATKDKGTNLT
jgi:hypothetical protein